MGAIENQEYMARNAHLAHEIISDTIYLMNIIDFVFDFKTHIMTRKDQNQTRTQPVTMTQTKQDPTPGSRSELIVRIRKVPRSKTGF